MKIKNSTLFCIRPNSFFSFLSLCLLMMGSTFSAGLQAQCVMACNDLVNVTLTIDNCDAVIAYDQVLEGSNGCQGPFDVTVMGTNGLPLPTNPRVTASEAGLTLDVKVTDQTTGLSCWGMIQIEDKNIPDLVCQNRTTTCIASAAPEAVGFPVPAGNNVFQTPAQQGSREYTVQGFDPCGDAILSYTDSERANRCAQINNVITRLWTIRDGAGNMTSCTETISQTRVTPADAIMPANVDGVMNPALNCEDRCPAGPRPTCGNQVLGWNVIQPGDYPNDLYVGHPSPKDDFYPCNGQVRCVGTGEPTNFDCGDIRITFTDRRINICTSGPSEGCYKIIRNWTLIDWCGGPIRRHDQIIKVEDNEGPTISDIQDVTISTDVWRCEADWVASQAWLSDNCSSDPLSYTLTSTAGNVVFQFGNYTVKDLPIGVHTITYTATDCCNNTSTQTVSLTVIDDVPPVVICDQHTVVTLTTTTDGSSDNLGTSKILARTFDDGSFDSCKDQIWFKALKMDEFDSNGNGKGGESVISGDYEAVNCNAADGDDDIRAFPPSSVFSPTLNTVLISNRSYNNQQAYFDDFVKFCCEDVGAEPEMVVFRVFDVDPTPYEFRNVFPESDPRFAAWYASNPHKSADEYTGVIAEAMSSNDWPVPNAGPGPLWGHFSDCMVEVEVQEKLPPYVVAPPNITISCDFWFEFDDDNPNDYTDELDGYFGKVIEGSSALEDRDSIITRDRVCPAHPRFAEFAPASPFDDPCYDDQYNLYWGIDGYALDNCSVDLEQTIVPNLHCGAGTIQRSWRATDAHGNWSNIARQTITIINCREFYVPGACWRFTPRDIGSCDFVGGQFLEKLIEWPCDIELSRCQGPLEEVFLPENLDVFFDEDRRPRFADDNCSLIASSYEDDIYTFVDSSCVKIFRNWEVIDWCRYEDGLQPFKWEWTQVIKLLNTVGPKFDNCSQTVCGYGNPANPNAEQCVGEVTIDPGITDDCSMIDDLRIDYKFDIDNDGDYDQLGYSDNYGPVYPFPNPNNLPVRRFAAADYALTGFFPVGEHRILWAAEDGCGNVNICEYILQIDDCKPPTAYCLPGVSTIPMPILAGGFTEIWASDFDLDSYDNCTAQQDLRFAFSDDPTDRVIRRDCDDVTGIAEQLTIYVFDEADNYSTCLVGLLLSDCGNQTHASVSGVVEDASGQQIDEAMIHLEGFMTEDQMTGTDGFFRFVNLPIDNNYSIRPEKNTDHLNGVSTYDLVLMSKHILGIETLGSPYKMIAADVNKSGSITAFDLLEIRKLILYISTEFSNNTSWRFVPADYTFQTGNPFASNFPESYDINGLTVNMSTDFVAVKTGDVNDSAVPNRLQASEDRNAMETLSLLAADRELVAGELYTIDFATTEAATLAGFQYSLDFDSDMLEYVGQQSDLEGMSAANYGTQLLDQGILTSSWNQPAQRELQGEVIFSLSFRAKRAGRLSKAIQLNSSYTSAEAYQVNATGGIDVLNIELTFKDALTENAGVTLLQNTPNPFKNETLIGFVFEEQTAASLTVYDVSGKRLFHIAGTYQAGYNEVSVNRDELQGASGLLYYTLETAKDRITKKMIHLE